MAFRKIIQNALASSVRGLSERLFGVSERPSINPPTGTHNPAVPPAPAVGQRQYDHKKHKAFYTVSVAVLRTFLTNPTDKSPRALAEATGFAESSVRMFCSDLEKEGVLRVVRSYPLTYTIGDPLAALRKVEEYEGIVGPYIPSTPAKDDS